MSSIPRNYIPTQTVSYMLVTTYIHYKDIWREAPGLSQSHPAASIKPRPTSSLSSPTHTAQNDRPAPNRARKLHFSTASPLHCHGPWPICVVCITRPPAYTQTCFPRYSRTSLPSTTVLLHWLHPCFSRTSKSCLAHWQLAPCLPFPCLTRALYEWRRPVSELDPYSLLHITYHSYARSWLSRLFVYRPAG